MIRLNNFFKERLINLNSLSADELKPILKRALYLSDFGIENEASLKKFIYLEKKAEEFKINLTDGIRKDIFSKADDAGDINYLLLKEKIANKNLQKVAYPNPGLSPDSFYKEVDLNKWLEIVNRIYKECKAGHKTKQEALEFYSNILNKEERHRFLRWFSFYSDGEHLKYSKNKEDHMKKESVFQSDLGQGNNPYYHDGPGFYFQNRNLGNNMPGDSFTDSVVSKNDDGKIDVKEANSEKKSNWKKSLHTAIRRIDKLMRDSDFMDNEEYTRMANLLLELSIMVKSIKLASTMGDVTYKTASIFKESGYKNHADTLMKLAQEISPEVPPTAPTEAPAAAPMPESPGEVAAAPEGPSQQEQASGVSVPEPDDIEPASLRDIEPIPGPAKDEYDILAGDIKLDDAAGKLDEVAGMLADRRIIRQLAEFDIMLDKIGIASMFPELAESQSKLIDAYSYALTRVTKMMGQLANAKTLLEADNKTIPGATPAVETEAIPEATPTE
jgi:hypothetical protein